MKKIFLIALPLCVLGFSCERHDFEETKKLHQSHGSHGGHGDDHGHGADHGKKDDGHGH
ncbi:hypothetical protein OVA24_09555 [Luteolibacter sp. SL250]|uniref:hypothetical protein n=1 Tax=Luteolibacter sp. SL250 TaxID=2995170 RepID=UPI00227178BB|nr:hypothetical protein [Luteolibacter sp. SL250]WAC21629.1 hypothetical protein OVA24_09555 [Luteolibacter sp. SL250]